MNEDTKLTVDLFRDSGLNIAVLENRGCAVLAARDGNRAPTLLSAPLLRDGGIEWSNWAGVEDVWTECEDHDAHDNDMNTCPTALAFLASVNEALGTGYVPKDFDTVPRKPYAEGR